MGQDQMSGFDPSETCTLEDCCCARAIQDTIPVANPCRNCRCKGTQFLILGKAMRRRDFILGIAGLIVVASRYASGHLTLT